MRTRDIPRRNYQDMLEANYYISNVEPTRVKEALLDPDWILAMQKELHQFKKNDFWTLVPRPK